MSHPGPLCRAHKPVEQHLRFEHKTLDQVSSAVIPKEMHRCQLCPKVFGKKYNMIWHLFKDHGAVASDSEPKPVEKPQPDRPLHPRSNLQRPPIFKPVPAVNRLPQRRIHLKDTGRKSPMQLVREHAASIRKHSHTKPYHGRTIYVHKQPTIPEIPLATKIPATCTQTIPPPPSGIPPAEGRCPEIPAPALQPTVAMDCAIEIHPSPNQLVPSSPVVKKEEPAIRPTKTKKTRLQLQIELDVTVGENGEIIIDTVGTQVKQIAPKDIPAYTARSSTLPAPASATLNEL